MKRVFVAAHVSKIYGPVQALQGRLLAWGWPHSFVSLPFSFAGMDSALAQRFEQGRLVETRRGHRASGWDPWLWVKDFFFVLASGWRAGAEEPIDLFVGVDCLNATPGILLKWMGRVKRVSFYVIDYTTQRFENPLLNALYQAFDRFAVAGSDVVWNLSERMREVRRKQGLPEARNLLVPVGVELEAVKHPARSQVKRKRLLYMGALLKGKGIELLIEAFPEILKKAPGCELHLIGFGPFEAEMRRLAAASPARKAIHIPGGMGHAELFKKVPYYGIAFAPYLDAPGSYTWWCDPSKPKEYLACGLPLIITKVPWIWERVADKAKPMGLAIDYERAQVVEAALKLLKDERFYWRCRSNALDFAKGLEWDAIYRRAFAAEAEA
jgi:glycosyltransferase involved in cell wall biosynthesis